MFKAIGHEKQILIVLLWSGLIFIGYNVLTAEAEDKECSSLSEPDDYLYCDDFDWSAFSPDRKSVDEMCDASEDYEKNPKNCDKAYDLVEKAEKDECKDANGDWKNGKCTYYEDEQEQDPTTNQDWKNTVTKEPALKINSPIAIEGDDVDKKLDDYNKYAENNYNDEDIAEYN